MTGPVRYFVVALRQIALIAVAAVLLLPAAWTFEVTCPCSGYHSAGGERVIHAWTTHAAIHMGDHNPRRILAVILLLEIAFICELCWPRARIAIASIAALIAGAVSVAVFLRYEISFCLLSATIIQPEASVMVVVWSNVAYAILAAAEVTTIAVRAIQRRSASKLPT